MANNITRQKLTGFRIILVGRKLIATEYASAADGKVPLLRTDSPKAYAASQMIDAVAGLTKFGYQMQVAGQHLQADALSVGYRAISTDKNALTFIPVAGA